MALEAVISVDGSVEYNCLHLWGVRLFNQLILEPVLRGTALVSTAELPILDFCVNIENERSEAEARI